MALSLAILPGLSGCMSTEQLGPVQYHSKTPIESAKLKKILYHGTVTAHDCPKDSLNACAPVFDLRFSGPAALYAYDMQEHHQSTNVSVNATVQDAMKQWSSLGMWAGENALIGAGSPALFGVGMLFSLGSGNNAPKINPVPGDYDHLAKRFNDGQILWIARYYKVKHNSYLQVVHLARKSVELSDLHLVGWDRGTFDGSTYRIKDGLWNDGADAMLVWLPNWQNIADKPKIAPYWLNWTVQPWKKPDDPFYVVNNEDPKYPFMALATIEYKISPEFNAPAWIQAHQAQLQGWMVIYHQKNQAAVWKEGKTHLYPEPKPLTVAGG